MLRSSCSVHSFYIGGIHCLQFHICMYACVFIQYIAFCLHSTLLIDSLSICTYIFIFFMMITWHLRLVRADIQLCSRPSVGPSIMSISLPSRSCKASPTAFLYHTISLSNEPIFHAFLGNLFAHWQPLFSLLSSSSHHPVFVEDCQLWPPPSFLLLFSGNCVDSSGTPRYHLYLDPIRPLKFQPISIPQCWLLIPRNTFHLGSLSVYTWQDFRSILYSATHSLCSLLRTREGNMTQCTENLLNKPKPRYQHLELQSS